MSTLAIRPRRRNLNRPFAEGLFGEADRNDLDRMWESGFQLGLMLAPAIANPDWPPFLQDSWHGGYSAGAARALADGEEGGAW